MRKIFRQLVHALGYEVFRYPVDWTIGTDVFHDVRKLASKSPVSTLFDVGANTGQVVQRMSKEFPDARIHAFEPVATTYEQLQENVSGLPLVACYPFGFSSQEGHATIALQDNAEHNSIMASAGEARTPTELISLQTLDEFAEEQGISTVDFLKTDTEGHDVEVLRGAAGMLDRKAIRFVYSEITFEHDDQQHTSFYEMKDYLDSKGYLLFAFYQLAHHRDSQGLFFANALFKAP